MKMTKRSSHTLAGVGLAFAMLVPAAASAQTHVFLGVDLGGLFAQPAPGYYQRPVYYAPRVVYNEPEVIYYQRGQRSWDYEQRDDWRQRPEQPDNRDWHHDEGHDWHHHRRDDDEDEDH